MNEREIICRDQASWLGFPGSLDGEESGCNGDQGSIPGLGSSPGEGNGNPLQFYCQENSMDQRSMVRYSPWGCKESGMTELLKFSLSFQASW